MTQHERLMACRNAIFAIDVPDLAAREMLAVLGYVAGVIIRGDDEPERMLALFETVLRRHALAEEEVRVQ